MLAEEVGQIAVRLSEVGLEPDRHTLFAAHLDLESPTVIAAVCARGRREQKYAGGPDRDQSAISTLEFFAPCCLIGLSQRNSPTGATKLQ